MNNLVSILSPDRITHFFVPTFPGSNGGGETYVMGFALPLGGGNSEPLHHRLSFSSPGSVNKEYSITEFGSVIKTWENWKSFFTSSANAYVRVLTSGRAKDIPTHEFVVLIDSIIEQG